MVDGMTNRRSFSKRIIVDHWVDSGKFNCCLTDICWICGDCTLKLEKCHIEPLWRGGLDELDNLILLCPNCHLHTEGFSVEQFWFYVEAYPFDILGQVMIRAYAAGQMPKDDYKYWQEYKKVNATP
jgi:hypothetical protein